MQRTFFQHLPDEVVLLINNNLPRKDQASLAQVDRRCHSVATYSQTELTQYKEQQWQAAVESKDADEIKKRLVNNGIVPNDLTAMIIVQNSQGKDVRKLLISIVIEEALSARDEVNFDVADQLHHRGATLPQPPRQRSSFENTSDFFKHLVNNVPDLYIALRSNPHIMREQDEGGMALLHYAAGIGCTRSVSNVSLIHHLLLTAPDVDFTIKNDEGNTPLHVAALCCGDRVTYNYIFPWYLRKAVELGFDFSILNGDGQSILHITTIVSYEKFKETSRKRNNVNSILQKVPDLDLNVLSSSGATAFSYAIKWIRIQEAHDLLDAGADPMRHGDSDKSPLQKIDNYIKKLTRKLSKEEFALKTQILKENIEDLKQLKQRVLSIDFSNKEHKKENFPFWAKNTESKKWESVNTKRSKLPENNPSGPGYGF